MRVALALGSGGARGYAHIGVIEELHERGHEIVGIAGSSMGALVGGLEAAGRLDQYTAWASSLTQRAILRLLDPSLTTAGVLRAEKVLEAVREILGDVTIEQLPIPFTSVATDLITGRSVWLQRGPVDDAIRASIAIPGIITPHVLDGRLLADGGILDPIPMAPIAAVNAELQRLHDGQTDDIALEMRCLHRDGSVIWVSAHGSLFSEVGAEAPCLILQAHDITARHEAINILEEANAAPCLWRL